MAISTERARASYADAEPTPFWLDRPDAPSPCSPLDGPATADLAIVGGGYTGLWTAIQAKEEDPGRDVVLVERDTIAFGASGRNGGFCDATLTHGLENGLSRFPDEIDRIEAVGRESFRGLDRDDRAPRHRVRLGDQRGGRRGHRTASGRLAPRGRPTTGGPAVSTASSWIGTRSGPS